MSSPEQGWVAALIREIGESGRDITDDELRRLRAHLATRSLPRPTMARADDELGGLEWQGRILRGGDWLPRLEAKYLKHVVVNEEWPAETTFDEYAESLARAVQNPNGGGYLEWGENVWKLTFVVRSPRRAAPGDRPCIVVMFYPERDFWVTGFQYLAGLARLRRQRLSRGGRWLRSVR